MWAHIPMRMSKYVYVWLRNPTARHTHARSAAAGNRARMGVARNAKVEGKRAGQQDVMLMEVHPFMMQP